MIEIPCLEGGGLVIKITQLRGNTGPPAKLNDMALTTFFDVDKYDQT